MKRQDQAEIDALRASGETLSTIIDAIPQFVWRTDPDGAADYASERFCQMVQLPPSEVLGWKWLELIHPDDRERVAADWLTARTAEGPVSIDFRLQSPTGYRWFRSEGAPYFKNGKLHKYYGTWTDIQERKLVDAARELAEERIANSEREFRTMANSIPQHVWMAEPDGHVFWYNQRWYEYTGTDEDSMRRTGWRPLHHPEHIERVAERVHEFWEVGWRTNEIWEDTFPLRGRDGSYRWFLSRMHPIKDDEGRVLRWFGTNTDIQDQRQLAADLEQAKVTAEKANEAKTAFLVNMSHEIRTPLTAITGFSDLLATSVPDNPITQNYVHRITRNAQQLSRLIDELLDLSKIEARKLEVEQIPVDLRAAVEDVVSAVSLQASEKNLQLEIVGLADLPSRAITDPTRLRQIIINLAGNAIKFTSAGRVRLEFAIQGKSPHRRLELRVSDTGIGLTDEQRRRLFKPFAQADSSITRKFGGSGLGLALSRELAHLLGGDLRIERSAPNEGSVFLLEIALEDAPEPSPTFGDQAGEANVNLAEISLEGLRLLIVDDSNDNQILVSRYVSRAGAQFETANNGQEAVEKARSSRFDVILMDLQMPIMDGYTALKILRAEPGRHRIVALTAHALQSEKDRCAAAGFDAYVTKPIHRQALLTAISGLVATRGSLEASI